MPFINLLLSLLLLAFSVVVPAATLPMQTMTAEQLVKPVDIKQVLVLEDRNSALTANEALNQIRSQGKLVAGTPRLGYSDSAWWVAFELNAPPAMQLEMIIDQAFTDDIELWLYDRDRLIAPIYSGDHLPFLQRGEPFPRFMLTLPRLGVGPHTLLLRVHSASAVSLPMQLVSSEKNTLLVAVNWLLGGLLIGGLMSLAVFYMLKFRALREQQLGYFCITALALCAYSASLHGVIDLLFSQWPWLSKRVVQVANPLMLIFSTLFIISALRLKLGTVLRLALNVLIAIIVLVSLWNAVYSDDYRGYQAFNLVLLLVGLFQALVVTLSLIKRLPYSRGYFLCWISALVMMTVLPLGRLGIINLPSDAYALQTFLPLLSMLLFSAVLDRQLENVRKALLSSQSQAIDNLEQYRALFNSAREGIFRCTLNGTLLEANPSLIRFLGSRPGDGSWQALPVQKLLGTTQWTKLVAKLDAAHPSVSQECQLRDLNGKRHWVYLSLHLRSAHTCIEGIIFDLSDRRQLEDRLKHQAAHDSLTGLLNRRELERLLQLSLLSNDTSRFSHLLYIDLDQFKQVNDLCGHSAGDQLLKQLSAHMQNMLPKSAQLARIGGDEFVVLLREQDHFVALGQAERLRRSVEQFVFIWENTPFRLHASIGVLTLSQDICDWETALRWADSASQQAKVLGRNRVQQFNPTDGALQEQQRQLQWITRLQEAMRSNHFVLFYQPVMPLQTVHDELHYELLLRYCDPATGEFISPERFMRAAERYSLLVDIDRWVVRNLCQWLSNNPEHLQQLGQVNLNLSTHSLLDASFHIFLSQELMSKGIPPHKVCIEVTEMVALGELAVSTKWLKSLRSQGFKVALDDFGSGFASYAYLRHLPLDILKIDGSFIRGIEHDRINQAMVGSMQQIAKQLGLQTVAEFVETQESLECLRALGIDYGQGYWIAEPAPLSSLTKPLPTASARFGL